MLKIRLNCIVFILGLVFILLSYLTYYYVGIGYSHCPVCNYSGNWLTDLNPFKQQTGACSFACSLEFENLVPNPNSVLFGWIGIVFILIGLVKTLYDYIKK